MLGSYIRRETARLMFGSHRTWRKQLLIAKEARRVDVLCSRISLSHKILNGTERYKELQRIIDSAAKKLKKEVGPLDRVSAKMARGIVNRLASGHEVQKLCSYAVETLDCMLSGPYPVNIGLKGPPTCLIQFQEASSTSVVVVLAYEDNMLEDFLGCRLWHRKSAVVDYPNNHSKFFREDSLSNVEGRPESNMPEDFATWQRIIRLDAVRANAEWIVYSPAQAAVTESKAIHTADVVGLKDYDHLEPCRIFHAARLVAILEAYALYDTEIGYCQGMSDLLSPIVAVIEEDYEAFWCFVGFMKKARHNFRLDEVGIRRQLNIVSKIIKCKDSHLYRHLESGSWCIWPQADMARSSKEHP